MSYNEGTGAFPLRLNSVTTDEMCGGPISPLTVDHTGPQTFLCDILFAFSYIKCFRLLRLGNRTVKPFDD